jgi:hypothetical protein
LFAYLRGYLNKDYEQGLISRAREEIILQHLAFEQEREFLKFSVLVESGYTPVINKENLSEFVSKIQRNVKIVRQLSKFDYDLDDGEEITNERQKFAEVATKIYRTMEKKGMI